MRVGWRYNRAMIHSTTEQKPSNSDPSFLAGRLKEGCEQLEIAVTSNQIDQLLQHIDLLTHWNRSLNLTAIRSPAEMVVQHLLDSLAVADLIRGPRVLDIGSGSGFPGIPLAILRPSLETTLLDSRGKRVEFLRHVVTTLELGNVDLVHARVEQFRPAAPFNSLICRAFASLADIFHRTKALQSPGTALVAMKGKYPDEEIEQLPAPAVQTIEVHRLNVPLMDAERHAVMIRF